MTVSSMSFGLRAVVSARRQWRCCGNAATSSPSRQQRPACARILQTEKARHGGEELKNHPCAAAMGAAGSSRACARTTSPVRGPRQRTHQLMNCGMGAGMSSTSAKPVSCASPESGMAGDRRLELICAARITRMHLPHVSHTPSAHWPPLALARQTPVVHLCYRSKLSPPRRLPRRPRSENIGRDPLLAHRVAPTAQLRLLC